MHSISSKGSPRGWAIALLLVGAGFIGGLTISAGGGRTPTSFTAVVGTAEAVAQPVLDQNLSYADVAEIAMPAVVNISTDKVVENEGWVHPFMDDPIFRRFFDVPRNQGRERVQRSLGSGVIISRDGYIMTNNHVVERASSIRVSFQNNEEYEAEIIGADPHTDVALIKIDADDLDYVRFANSTGLRIGEQVMAIGNPFGLGQTVTLGIVSALGRSIGLIEYEDLIQTDAAINMGNSGGALVNMRGELIGMNTAILSRTGGSQGIGFAIPSSMAERIVGSLRDSGRVERAWLGVTVRDVDQSLAEALDLGRPRGVLINTVNADTPAEKAGLKDGDVIISVDGQEVNSTSRLRSIVSLSPIGHEARLDLLRDGKEKRITVKLAKLPEENLAAASPDRGTEISDGIEGVTVRQLTSRFRRMSDIPDDIEGVFVSNVERRSKASREGLESGDVILEIAREAVLDLDDYQRLVGKDEDKPILLRVYKPQSGGRIFMAIPR